MEHLTDVKTMDDYSKYMTIAPLPEKILKTFETELSGEGVLEKGHCYFRGMDAEQDYEKAVECYRQAADQGIADAYLALSLCYKSGKGVEADQEQERILLEKGIKVLRRNLCGRMGLEDQMDDLESDRKSKESRSEENASCSFCGKPVEKVKTLFTAGVNGVYICNECVDICAEILDEQSSNEECRDRIVENNPEEKKNYLDGNFINLLFEGTNKLCEQIDITKIVFSDSLDGDRKACDYRDISQQKDGSVIGWVEKPGKERCVLHIDGKGRIGAPEDSQSLFAGFEKTEEIVFGEVFSTTKVTNMTRMFYRCRSLRSVDVSGFDTAHVMSMKGMFEGCSSLRSVDVSGFDTARVTDMSWMFSKCSSLRSVDVSGFDTACVTGMICMFNDCSSLGNVDVSRFNTANVTDMSWMFSGCSSLGNVDVSRFDTARVMSMKGMFKGCSSLRSVDVSGFNTANVTNMIGMFDGCDSLPKRYRCWS